MRSLWLAAVVGISACHSLPHAEPGAAADELARRIERAVDAEGWRRTGAVAWSFRGGHQHLWDKQRNLARVRWGHNEVLVDLAKKTGRAFVDGREALGKDRGELVSAAWSHWANDSFWLNPLVKLFDEGVVRGLASIDKQPALLVTYTSGGDTPGDRYLWLLDGSGLPRAWRLWVKIIPIRGLQFSWERWSRLRSGGLVSTLHRTLGIKAVTIGDLAGAASLAEVEPGPDPFARILDERK